MGFVKAIVERARRVFRFRPHDTSTEHGRSTERYRRMALSSFAAFGARGISLFTSLISVPLTYRYLGAERYGIWMVLVSFITAMSVADLGIGNGVMNAISEANGRDDRELMREYASNGFFLMLGIGILLGVAGAVAYPNIPWMRVFNVKSPAAAAEGATAFLVLYAGFVLNIPLNVVNRIQAGLQRYYWSQTLIACGNALSLVGLIVVIELRGSLAWLVFASTFGMIAATIANGFILFRSTPWLLPSWSAFRTSTAKRIFNLGILFFVLQCTVALGFTSDNIVITQVMGAAAVAVYSVPQKLFGFSSQLINLGMLPIWPAYSEAIARGDFQWVRRAFRHSLAVTLAISCILCPLLAVTGPWIIRMAVGRTLHVPIPLFWVLALWGIIWAVWTPLAMLLNGAGSLKIQAASLALASLVNLALSICLTRRVGVMGVCLGSIIAQLGISIPVSVFLIHKLFKSMSDGTVRMNNGLSSTTITIG
jgi:O-antigen/teichoic acid export membrane protein